MSGTGLLFFLGLFLLVVLAFVVAHAIRRGTQDSRGVATPPPQPASGPGGREYRSGSVMKSRHGAGALAYWLFEPADPSPAKAPLVVFLHGWGAMNPQIYGAWIEHIVRRGLIVVYPLYQTSVVTPRDQVLSHAAAAIQDAIDRLQQGGHVRPDLDRFAVLGHSAGGTLGASLPGVAQTYRLPVAEAIMSVAPGRGEERARHPLPSGDYSAISPETLLLLVIAADDDQAGDREARNIFLNSTRVPDRNKNLVVVLSDDHGKPALIANHASPGAPSPGYVDTPRAFRKVRRLTVDALNFYGYWKVFDALTDAAFYETNWEFVLGNAPQLRFMGQWSDGTPVKELQVLTHHDLKRES